MAFVPFLAHLWKWNPSEFLYIILSSALLHWSHRSILSLSISWHCSRFSPATKTEPQPEHAIVD